MPKWNKSERCISATNKLRRTPPNMYINHGINIEYRLGGNSALVKCSDRYNIYYYKIALHVTTHSIAVFTKYKRLITYKPHRDGTMHF